MESSKYKKYIESILSGAFSEEFTGVLCKYEQDLSCLFYISCIKMQIVGFELVTTVTNETCHVLAINNTFFHSKCLVNKILVSLLLLKVGIYAKKLVAWWITEKKLLKTQISFLA